MTNPRFLNIQADLRSKGFCGELLNYDQDICILDAPCLQHSPARELDLRALRLALDDAVGTWHDDDPVVITVKRAIVGYLDALEAPCGDCENTYEGALRESYMHSDCGCPDHYRNCPHHGPRSPDFVTCPRCNRKFTDRES